MLAPVLTFSAPATNQLRLSWEPIEGADLYTIQFRTSTTAAWSTLGTTGSNTWLHSGLAAGTLYYYRIAAIGSDSLVWSESFSARIFYPASCNISKSATAITVNWGAVSGVTTYTVEHSTDNVTWETLTENATGTSFADTTFEYNTWNYYRVTPNADTGVTRTANGYQGIWRTDQITAVPLDSKSVQIITPNPSDYTGSRAVQRATSLTGTWATVTNLYSDSNRFIDTNLTPGATYYYRVYCADGNYAELYVASEAVTLPNFITNFIIIRNGDVALLTWDLLENGQNYAVFRSTDQINWTEFPVESNFYHDSAPVEGVTNYYKITALIDGVSYSSQILSLLFLGTVPTFTVTPQSNGSVYLSWSAAQNASNYQIQRRASGTDEWTSLSASYTRLYYNDNIGYNARYDYRVAPVNGKWKQVDSVWFPNTQTLAPSATALDDGTIRLTWTELPAAENYDILRATTGEYEKIASTAATSFIDTQVVANTTYSYRVGFEPLNMFSSVTSATAIYVESGETVLTFTPLGTTSIRLSWEAVAETDSYTIQFRADSTDDWRTLGSTETLAFDHTGLSTNRDYFFRRSVNSAEAVLWSKSHATRIYYPTSLSSTVSAAAIALSWSAVTNVTSYTVERSTDSLEWTTLSTNVEATTFSDHTIEHNVNYIYRVTPNKQTGVARTLQVTGYYQVAQLTAALTDDGAVQITYPNRTAFVGTRTLYRTTVPTWTNPTRLTTSSSTAASITLTDSTAQPGETYYYWLACGSAEAVRSDAITIPLTFTATCFALADRICLSWDSLEDGAFYTIFRSSDRINWTEQTTDANSFIDTSFDYCVEYFYRVEATVGEVHYRTDLVSGLILGPPEKITVTRTTYTMNGQPTQFRLSLSWTACPGASAYVVEVRTIDGDWQQIVANTTATSYIYTITRNVMYYFRVRPVGGALWGTVGPVWYPNVTDLYPDVTLTDDGYLKIDWTPIPNAPGYVITRSTTTSGTYTPIATLDAPTFVDRSAMPNTRYYYKVGFPDDNLWSVYITEISGNYPAPPTGMTMNNQRIAPDSPAGTLVGNLAAVTTTLDSVYTFSFCEGDGDTDNDRFDIDNNSLLTAEILPEGTYSIRLRAIDENGLFAETAFEITAMLQKLATPILNTKTISYKNVTLYWGTVTDATGYRLEYRADGEEDWSNVTLNRNYTYSNPYTLSGLNANRRYEIRLFATAVGYKDSDPAELTATTLADTNPPELRRSTSGNLYVEPGGVLTLPTVTATDAVDGNVPVTYQFYNAQDEPIDEIDTMGFGPFTVVWTAVDSSGNSASISATILITDKVPPVIALTPYGETDSAHAVLPLGGDYIEYGATALDSYEGPVEVTIAGTVDTTVSGLYTVTYSAADSAQNSATEYRKIIVTSASSPAVELTTFEGANQVRLDWTLPPEIAVNIERRERGSDDWTQIAQNVNSGSWNDTLVAENTLYYYRLTAGENVLSNEAPCAYHDTTPPTLLIHPYGDTGNIDVSIPLGSDYTEYGAEASDRVDMTVPVEITSGVDTSACGLYEALYLARDTAGFTSSAKRRVLVYDSDYIAWPTFNAAAVSQNAIRLTWPGDDSFGVTVERRSAETWSTLAESVTGGVYDDTSAEPFVDYYYRLTLADGQPLTAENIAWLVQVTHFSSVVQPVEVTAAKETPTANVWSSLTEYSPVWQYILETF